MVRRHRLRATIAQFTLWIATVASVAYFAHHAFVGDRGIRAKRAYEVEIASLKSELKAQRRAHKAAEERVASLRLNRLDRDMLDQLARERLGFIHPDERILELPAPAR